jgi:transcriptional regulator with XRE-family HTH domain
MPTTTAKAIMSLREKLGLTQQQFAERLGVSPFSVSRYEGGREPSREVIGKLSRLAAAAKLDSIHGFFQHKREIEIKESYKNLPSKGTGRHIPLGDLKTWSAFLRKITENLETAKRSFGSNPTLSAAAVDNAHFTAEHLRDDLELYIGRGQYSSTILQEENKIIEEEEELIRLHSAAWRMRE